MEYFKLEDLPIEIYEKVLERQVEQGNPRNPRVFDNETCRNKEEGGFTWRETIEGTTFWVNVLYNKKYDLFYEKYPKENKYPKVMLVSTYPITNTNPGIPRVVFMEKNGYYIAWVVAETIKDSEKKVATSHWKYAKDLPEEPKVIEVTLKDVASKFNIPVEKLRIKE